MREAEKASETRGKHRGRVSLILQRSSILSSYEFSPNSFRIKTQSWLILEIGDNSLYRTYFGLILVGKHLTTELLLQPMFYNLSISVCMSMASDWYCGDCHRGWEGPRTCFKDACVPSSASMMALGASPTLVLEGYLSRDH